uniref:Uncharacterized protein n=1 Tax=Compsopogon caeruleus TaxID=31354 RepID=A0A7S1XD38_9RHOD
MTPEEQVAAVIAVMESQAARREKEVRARSEQIAAAAAAAMAASALARSFPTPGSTNQEIKPRARRPPTGSTQPELKSRRLDTDSTSLSMPPEAIVMTGNQRAHPTNGVGAPVDKSALKDIHLDIGCDVPKQDVRNPFSPNLLAQSPHLMGLYSPFPSSQPPSHYTAGSTAMGNLASVTWGPSGTAFTVPNSPLLPFSPFPSASRALMTPVYSNTNEPASSLINQLSQSSTGLQSSFQQVNRSPW